MLKKFVFISASSLLLCLTSSSVFAATQPAPKGKPAAPSTPVIQVKHDPKQCPKGIEGHYKISADSDMNVYVTRNADKNLVIQFQTDDGVAGDPSIVDGKYEVVNSVHDDGSSYEAGKSVYFCQNSAVYSKFVSNDESDIASNTTKFTVVPHGLEVQEVIPASSDVKFWPRVN